MLRNNNQQRAGLRAERRKNIFNVKKEFLTRSEQKSQSTFIWKNKSFWHFFVGIKTTIVRETINVWEIFLFLSRVALLKPWIYLKKSLPFKRLQENVCHTRQELFESVPLNMAPSYDCGQPEQQHWIRKQIFTFCYLFEYKLTIAQLRSPHLKSCSLRMDRKNAKEGVNRLQY